MTHRGWLLVGLVAVVLAVLALFAWAGGERPLTRTVVPVALPERAA